MSESVPPFRVLASCEDASANHVAPAADGGYWESRFVQRVPDYWICYLSSHTGCNKSCRFCHLTATGQTTMTPATRADYRAQARAVFETYDARRGQSARGAERVHFNFMARGEPLANPTLLRASRSVYSDLEAESTARGLRAAFKVSSIIPRDFEGSLCAVLDHPEAQLFYSLYSMSPRFRKRWLPKAMDPEQALALIARHQADSGKDVVLHWAFIAGENDADADITAILEAVHRHGVRARFNLVRYNPHDGRHGHEPDEVRLQALFERVRTGLGHPASRIVPRVGYDVKASCGMFVEPSPI